MSHASLRAPLEKRYSNLTADLQQIEANIERIRREAASLPELESRVPIIKSLIESAAMLLRDADPAWEPEQTPPVREWSHSLPIPFGSCGRRAMEVLRRAEQAMTVREVAKEVLRQAGTDVPDAKTLAKTVNAVTSCFRKFDGRTIQSSGKYPAQWRTVINQGVEFEV